MGLMPLPSPLLDLKTEQLLSKLTPIEKHDKYLVKRDDIFQFAGVRGGKVRTCLWLAKQAKIGLVTAGSRFSPQINIVAHIGRYLGLPVRAHTPKGELSQELYDAQKCGAAIIQHRAGYNSVICARAKTDAISSGYTYIPFGMQCQEAIEQTRKQAANLCGQQFERIVVPIGSAMSFCGILWGLRDHNIDIHIPILGVVVGANPTKTIQKFAPSNVHYELCHSNYDYHDTPEKQQIGSLKLDPHYEAKCVPFLRSGDLLWVVGIRRTAE